jgi:hypothetical protein
MDHIWHLAYGTAARPVFPDEHRTGKKKAIAPLTADALQ